MKVIDLRHVLLELKQSDEVRFQQLFDGHMSAEGNSLVTDILFQTMAEK